MVRRSALGPPSLPLWLRRAQQLILRDTAETEGVPSPNFNAVLCAELPVDPADLVCCEAAEPLPSVKHRGARSFNYGSFEFRVP